MIPELIAGAIVSLILQIVKKYTNAKAVTTLGILLLLSFIASLVYTALLHFGYWESVVNILITASGVYGVIKGVSKVEIKTNAID